MEPLDIISRGGHEGASILPLGGSHGHGGRCLLPPGSLAGDTTIPENESTLPVAASLNKKTGYASGKSKGVTSTSETEEVKGVLSGLVASREVLGGAEESKESKRRTHCGKDVTTMSSFREREKASMA